MNLQERQIKCANGLSLLFNYCYTHMRTTYPYECPYNGNIMFEDYNHFLASLYFGNSWIDVRKNHDYGYFEYVGLNSYGQLFSDGKQGPGDCMITNLFTRQTADCKARNIGFCVYRNNNQNNICKSYNQICGSSQICSCPEKKFNFYCETSCSKTINKHCTQCQRKFNNYPSPYITVQFTGKIIVVTIFNHLKLHNLDYGHPIFCFKDVHEPEVTHINYKFNSNELLPLRSGFNRLRYAIQVDPLAPGRYWCEGFVYPQLNKVSSNVILAGLRNRYGLNFVVNVTISITNQYTFLPYNIHTRTTALIKNVLHHGMFTLVRPIYISHLYNEEKNADLIFHLTTSSMNTDYDYVNENLGESLKRLTHNMEIEKYTVSNSEMCNREVTVINEVDVFWPKTYVGQIATPENSIFLMENGLPITRVCRGDFSTGVQWSNVSGITFYILFQHTSK